MYLLEMRIDFIVQLFCSLDFFRRVQKYFESSLLITKTLLNFPSVSYLSAYRLILLFKRVSVNLPGTVVKVTGLLFPRLILECFENCCHINFILPSHLVLKPCVRVFLCHTYMLSELLLWVSFAAWEPAQTLNTNPENEFSFSALTFFSKHSFCIFSIDSGRLPAPEGPEERFIISFYAFFQIFLKIFLSFYS